MRTPLISSLQAPEKEPLISDGSPILMALRHPLGAVVERLPLSPSQTQDKFPNREPLRGNKNVSHDILKHRVVKTRE